MCTVSAIVDVTAALGSTGRGHAPNDLAADAVIDLASRRIDDLARERSGGMRGLQGHPSVVLA